MLLLRAIGTYLTKTMVSGKARSPDEAGIPTGPVFLKLGKSVRYRQTDLDRFLEKRARTSTSDRWVDDGPHH
jgi:hypothetical protein